MVFTRAYRQGRSKAIRPSNREWATAIICVNGEVWTLPLFLLLQGAFDIANWYTKSELPRNWAIKTTSSGWTDNDTGIEWLKHFEKHTAGA